MPVTVWFEIDDYEIEISQNDVDENEDIRELQAWYLALKDSVSMLGHQGKANKQCGIYDKSLSFKLAQHRQAKEWVHRRLCQLGSVPKPGKTPMERVTEERDQLRRRLDALSVSQV